jgi:large subunit ribosomal protein L30e
MAIVEDVQSAIKSGKAIIGYKESIKFIKTGSPKLVVIAKNIPENMKKEIEYNTKISNIKLEIFDGSSKDLGIICGKPFPVSTIAIKG